MVKIGLGAAGFSFLEPKAFLRWVDQCEAGGVDSLWFSDRLISKAPTLEPLVAMSVVAGRTERMKFGMNVIVLPHRDPVVLAKECATLDYLSGGRLLPAFGVGGEIQPEWQALGTKPEGRGALSDEMLEVMTRLWSEEAVTYAGKHFHLDGAAIAPRPIQHPLPLWIGGNSPAAVRRTARYGHGWLAGLSTPAVVAPIVASIKKAAGETGRTIEEDHYGAGFPFRFGTWDEPAVGRAASVYARLGPATDPKAYVVAGGAPDILARVKEYRAAGIDKFVLRPIAENEAEVREQTARLMDEVIPAVAALG
jgi:probable F420-dependent oxidoreductase